MAINNKDCGCSPYTACSPVTCTSYVAPECEAFNLGTSNTLDRTGLTDVTDVTLDVKKISAFREHLEFVNSPVGLSNIIGHTVIRLSTSFLNGIANIFRGRNIGTGAKLYKGSKIEDADTFQDFRTLKGSESILVDEGTDEITFSVDTTWLDGELPTVNYPVIDGKNVGEGMPIYRGLDNKKIKIATLSSDSFIVSEILDPITNDPTGEIKINTPGGGSNSDDYYIDPTFTRPSNWLSKAESIDGIPTAKGTLNDPFLTYDEYIRRCVGSVTGSNGNGLFTRVNPENPNRVLQVLSSFETDLPLEVNNTTIYLKNNCTIGYTGNEEYAIDTERLWNAMPKTGGVLNREIYYEVKGEGGIFNKIKAGIINHKTSAASTTTTIKSLLKVTPTLGGLSFFEVPNSATYSPLTDGSNPTPQPFTHAGMQVMGSMQTPTTPLIKIKGRNAIDWGAGFNGTKLFIQTNIQSAIQVEGGSLISNLDNLSYLINANYIGYERKLYTGLGGMSADEIEVLGSKGLFFKPYANRNIFYSKDSSDLKILNLRTLTDQRIEVAVNSIFKVENSSAVTCSSFEEIGGGSSVSYIESIGTSNYLEIAKAEHTSNIDYFVKSNSNDVGVVFPNSNANTAKIISKNVNTLTIETRGTFSTIKNIPINSRIIGHTDNADAIAQGLIKGMIYFNNTTGAIDVVV